MAWVALNWTVFEFTGSALYLGLINACRLVPAFLLSVPAGVLADRSDRRKLLIALQAGVMLATFCVGYVLAAGSPFWLLAVVVTLRSALTADSLRKLQYQAISFIALQLHKSVSSRREMLVWVGMYFRSYSMVTTMYC